LGIRDELKKNFSCGFQAQEKGVRVLCQYLEARKTMSYIIISISSGIARISHVENYLKIIVRI